MQCHERHSQIVNASPVRPLSTLIDSANLSDIHSAVRSVRRNDRKSPGINAGAADKIVHSPFIGSMVLWETKQRPDSHYLPERNTMHGVHSQLLTGGGWGLGNSNLFFLIFSRIEI